MITEEEINLLKELIIAQDKYIKLLGKELDELANVHGWKSKRMQQGVLARIDIEYLKESLSINL